MALNFENLKKIMREESGVNRGSFVNHPAVGLRCAREYSNALIALQKKFPKTKDKRVEVMHGYLQAGDRPADFGSIRSGTKSC